ncbi:MAG: hypothetical protein ACKO1M_04370 [Planctomycetota bacterium]
MLAVAAVAGIAMLRRRRRD